jgi:Pyruvate/2-oxoacid:ferredoxin oxidoreductase delta subunit
MHLKEQLNREEDRANQLDVELADLRQSYTNLSKDKQTEGGNVDTVLHDQIEQLMNQNKDLKEHNKELEKKSQPTKRLEVKIDKKDKEIEKLYAKNEKLQEQIAQLEDGEVAAVGSKKEATGADSAAVKSKNKEIDKLKVKVEKLEDRIETLTITADARKEEVKNLHILTKDQEREIKAYKSEVVAVGKDKDKTLQKSEKIKEKETTAAKLKAQELELKLEQNKGKLSSEIDKLKKDMAEMKLDYENRLKILKEQSMVLNNQLDESEQGIRDRDKEIKKLLKQIEEMSVQVIDAENLIAEHKEVKTELKGLINDYGVVEVKYKEEVKKRKKLHNQIEDIKGKVRVFARARPMSKDEIKKKCKFITTFPDEMSIQVQTKNGPKAYNFDSCFGPNSTQEEVFEQSCPLIQSAIDGFNVCMFAYGQTGSGKTYTIQGDAKNPGLTPRIFEEMFIILDSMDNYDIDLTCYMVELYLENLKDLLRPKKQTEVPLDIKKNAHGMVIVEGAHEVPIESVSQANKIFEYGLDNRKTAATNMNATSSRSHLVFSIIINSTNKQTGQKTVGKLSLVDLAGSERVSKTGAAKERLQEALAINKSLSALGNVISALGDNKKKHIPYRDNKLTMLMEDSLGGNAKTLMFVNVSPADYNADETNTSLGYAKRVKNIKNFAVKNTKSKQSDKMNSIILDLQTEITRLEKKLEDGGVKFRRTVTNFNLDSEDEDEDGRVEEMDGEQEFNPDEED